MTAFPSWSFAVMKRARLQLPDVMGRPWHHARDIADSADAYSDVVSPPAMGTMLIPRVDAGCEPDCTLDCASDCARAALRGSRLAAASAPSARRQRRAPARRRGPFGFTSASPRPRGVLHVALRPRNRCATALTIANRMSRWIAAEDT